MALRTAVHRNRDLLVLVSLIAIVVIFPYFEDSPIGDILLVILSSALLLTSLYEVSDRRHQLAVGIFLAVPALLAAWVNLLVPSQRMLAVELIAMTAFLSYILLVILRRVLSARKVTITELYRAVNGYIMVGIAFGLVYTLIGLLSPQSFQFAYGDSSISSLFYFSFVALCTAGFGDIIAISPIARAVVIIEMIVGVMYMAVFIGLLVNAHYSSRYGGREEGGVHPLHPERAQGVSRFSFVPPGGLLPLVAIGLVLNLVTSVAMVSLNFPVFLDTWGTSLAVLAGGFPAGACTGVLYNTIMAVTVWDFPSLAFAASSILVAAATWFFWKRGWITIRSPPRLVAAGMITGLLNTCAVLGITTILHLPPYPGTIVVHTFLASSGMNPVAVVILGVAVVEVLDKTLSLALAAVAVIFLQDWLGREDRSVPPE